MDASQSPAADELEAQDALAEDILQRFVKTVLMVRAAHGSWDPEWRLFKFYVALPLDDDNGLVRINDEDGYWTHPRLRRNIEPHERVDLTDIVTELVPAPVETPQRYISGQWDGHRWVLDLRLAVPHPRRSAHLDAGAEFAATAHEALAKGRLRAFGENAFHAAEHLATAELLTYAAVIPGVAEARTHSVIRSIYHQWAHLGNTELRFAKLLDDLTTNRSSATYLRGQHTGDVDVAHAQASVLADLLNWVQTVEEGRGPDTVHLVAHGPIRAGQLISAEHAGVRKLKATTMPRPATGVS